MTTSLLTAHDFLKTLFNHIWLSISSVKFYQNVFLNYRGYGFKYIFILSIVSAMLSSMILLNYTDKIKRYLDGENTTSTEFTNIEHVFQQLPVFEYDGNAIIFDQQAEPVFINSLSNQKIVAIDPFNKLTSLMQAKIPVIILKDQINIHMSDQYGKSGNFSIKYNSIFSENPQTLTKENIKNSLAQLFVKSSTKITYQLFPILTLIIFFNTLYENSFLFLIILVFIKISRANNTMKDGIRVVLFSNGFYVLFQFLFLIGLMELNYIIWILQTWAKFLMIAAVIKSTPKFTIFKK